MTPPPLSEANFQTQLLDLAKLTRWLAHHCRAARKADGSWTTPIQGDPGFVDLVLVRGGRVLFVELKADRGVLSSDQCVWRDRLLLAGMEWYCWRPRDWPAVQKALAPAPHSSFRVIETIGTGGAT